MIGKTISHYKILEKLGEGGMGVVYKAQDTKLDRLVALKFLPEHVSVGSADLERFTQEAKAAAGLNHPNICTIYGIEEADNKNFIVMEFVDGQMLQEKKSSLSMKQALDVGIQIAEGLAAAHEKGIVHRDIKPENIMFRKDGRVQIMDFGLAKLRGASRLTKEGSTVGTAGYMSPEQVQGQETDHRSDIFSLGVLLYEMLTGQPPFKGVHETAITYEIVNVDSPPMSAIKPEIPPELDAIVLECLEKDPKERTQSASQIAVDLKRYRRESSRSRASRITAARPMQSGFAGALGIAPESAGVRPPSWILTGGIAFATLIVGLAVSLLPGGDTAVPVIRATVSMPPGIRYDDGLGGNSSISPDGSTILFVGRDSTGISQLWTRPLNSEVSTPLAGTSDATYPFWSYDGKSIGFFADGALRTISATGGPVVSLAEAPFGRGAAWSPNGTIIFAPTLLDPNLYGVSSGGGEMRAVTRFDTSARGVPRFPSFLPDGDHFVFAMLETGSNASDIYLGSLESGENEHIVKDGANPVYANGRLLFLRQGILMAQSLDPDSRKISGGPASIEGNLNSWSARAKADFSSSANGIMLYSGGVSSRTNENEFIWIAESGSVESILQAPTFARSSLSPDGTRIAFGQALQASGVDIWTYDTRRKVTTRLSFVAPKSAATGPAWSKDGQTIYYNSEQLGGKAAIYAKHSDGSGQEELLADGGREATAGYYPEDVSPDGRYLLFRISNDFEWDLATLDLASKERPIPPTRLGLQARFGRFSPDGKWIVYVKGLSGDTRIFVSEFHGRSGTWQASPADGTNPLWVGSTIVYFSPSRSSYMRVGVSFSAGSPVFGQPQLMFPGTSPARSAFLVGYSKAKKAYLGLRPVGSGSSEARLSLIVNWPELVK